MTVKQQRRPFRQALFVCALLPVLAAAMPAGSDATQVTRGAQTVSIDAAYPIGTAFENTFEAVETVSSTGAEAKTTTDKGTIRISRLPDAGHFLVSRATGSYIERTQDGTRSTSRRLTINATSEFDSLGYAKTRGADPAELIPIFPGKPVEAGSVWRVSSRVKSSYGAGVAYYAYRVASIRRASNGHTLAAFTVHLSASLNRGSASLHGTGHIVWDCTEHERASSKTTLVYRVHTSGRTIIDTQSEHDSFRRAP